jgi:hypothetical protein
VLTRRGADILVRLERLMEDATRALAAGDAPDRRAEAPDARTPLPQGTVASAPPRTGRIVRGN